MEILSWTPIIVLVFIDCIFIQRELYVDFPFFFSYISYALLAAALRAVIRNSPVAYFYTYWITDAILSLLALLALNEVFKHIFVFDYKQRWWFRVVLPITSLLIAAVFITQPLRPYQNPIANVAFSFDLGVNCLEALILLLLLFLDTVLMATKNYRDFGVVAGFGVSASVTILAELIRFHFGNKFARGFSYGPPTGFIVATIIWLVTFLRKPPAQERLPITFHELAGLLQKRAEFVQKLRRTRKLG